MKFWYVKIRKVTPTGTSNGTYSSISVTQGLFLELSVTTASLMAQTVKNPPAMWKDWVRSLGWKDPLEKEWLPTPVFLPGKSHRQMNPVGCNPWGCKESGMTERLTLESVKSIVLGCVWLLAMLWTVACQAPLSIGFSRKEYWSGLPFPSPGDLPNPGIEPRSPTLQVDSLLSEPSEKS